MSLKAIALSIRGSVVRYTRTKYHTRQQLVSANYLKMTIIRVIMLCVLGLITIDAMETGKSDQICEEPTTHYLELGCKPIYSRKNGLCPVRYECPFMSRSVNSEKCYYKSKEYALGERPGKNALEHACSVECVCNMGYEGKAGLTCANVECPELFFPRDPEKEHCIKQYKKKDCCSYNEICDKSEIEKLVKCEYDGKVYRDGEKFYPSGTCKTCICDKDFDGTTNSPSCNKINCGIEIFNSRSVNDKCAPIYLESRPCCPIGWKCGDEEEYFIDNAAVQKSSNSEMKCTFDSKVLDIGDKVKIEDKCITCTCNIPPLVTCIRSLTC